MPSPLREGGSVPSWPARPGRAFMGESPCRGGGKEVANCPHLVASGAEAGACFAIHFPGNCERGGRWPNESCCNERAWAFHFPVAFLIVANTAYNEANEGK